MSQITLLDGGMGQELIARAGDSPTPLWSTQVMRDHPGLVQQIHADYFAAGADIATANTYAIHRDRLRIAGIEDQFASLHDAALTEAEAARTAFGRGRIAGATGPLGNSYRPDLMPDHDTAVALYAEVAAQLQTRCDLLLAETVASVAHARAVNDALRGRGLPVWIALSVSDADGRLLRSGEPLEDALAHCGDADALLLNCSTPEVMPPALEILAQAGRPFGAYANGFTMISDAFLKDQSTVAVLDKRADLTPEVYADHALRWAQMGATIIGGCCETGPAHIAAVGAALRAAGFATGPEPQPLSA